MPQANMLDSGQADRILPELQSSAEAGDLGRFQRALTQWNDDGSLALQSVLSTAAKAGHADIVAHLLAHTDANCKVAAPAVRWAASRKHWDVMQAFIDAGWDINSPIDGGNTCSALKEVLPSEEHVRWYLDHGADPSFRSAGGNNHIPSLAGKFGTVATIKLLHSAGADFTKSNALHMAAGSPSKGRLEVMAYLLDELHVPLNQREYEYDPELYESWKGSGLHGGTALHAAVKEKKLENAEFLVGRGIGRGIKDDKGRRAVDFAGEPGLDSICGLLEAPVLPSQS